MRRIIIYTQAYNAEYTLPRAVDSVLSQTYANFEYLLVDNGSTDKTGEIIKEYANKDNRIIPLANKINHVWEPGNSIEGILSKYDDHCIFCWFDADDELAPQFFEKMLVFMEQNSLDIAICGNDFVDANTNMLLGIRKLDSDLLLNENCHYSEYFTQYYQFIRTVWAKLYSFSVLRNFDFEKMNRISYGWDTYFVIESLHYANRIGILSESLHKYYISKKSHSYQFDSTRIISDRILFEVARDFLISKCGAISNENLNFLLLVYLNAIKDSTNVLVNTQMSVIEKLNGLRDIFQSQHTQELARRQSLKEQKNELFRQVSIWILSQQEVLDSKGMEIAADIFAAMGMYPSQISGWQDGWVFLLLTKVKTRLAQKESLNDINSLIASLTSSSPLLAGLDAGFLTYFQDIVFSILQKDEKTALEQIEDIIAQGTDIPDKYIEAFLSLGIKLTTKLEYTNDFIFFKKLQISLLIDICRTEDAEAELADWDVVLPNDMDFKELRKRLSR